MPVTNNNFNGAVIKPKHSKHPETTVVETLTNGFFTVDKKWTVNYWNKAAEKILGVSAADILGKNLWQKFAGILPAEFYTVYQKAFLEDVPMHFEEYWGEMGAWFEVITYYSKDSLSVSFKSSNHPHAEYPERPVERLKTLTELYRFVTEITNDALWEWDFSTEEIFWIDGGHKRVFGYPIQNALIPQSFWENRIHPDDRARVLKSVKDIIAKAEVCEWYCEYRFACLNGTYAHVRDRGHIVYVDGTPTRMIGATQDVSENVKLEKELEEARRHQQRTVTGAAIFGHERERTAIAMALQENLSQMLAAINMHIQMAKKFEKERSSNLDKSSVYITEVIDEIGKIYKKLIIPNTGMFTLADNMQLVIEGFAVPKSLKINLLPGDQQNERYGKEVEVNLIRIMQEQLDNIVRHAGATEVNISLTCIGTELKLRIADNGIGWDATEIRKGVGITNIITRAELLQGTVNISSKPAHGFVLEVLIPLEKNICSN